MYLQIASIALMEASVFFANLLQLSLVISVFLVLNSSNTALSA